MTAQLPSIVIVGRPNVGKSTLFNRLTGTRRSIVTNEPGITRDRIYGAGEWRGRRFEVVDTGGIIPDEQAGIPGEILRQARVAIDRAAHLVLVVDARAGVTPLDAELARVLRQTGKPLAIAANKVDTAMQESLSAEFHKLSKHVFGISSEHGLGVDDLLDHIVGDTGTGDAGILPVETDEERHGDGGVTPHEIRVAIIGRPNVGKSTLLNRLVGAERAIVSPIPGTTRDAVDTMVERGGTRYRLVDTAGIRRKGKTKLIAEKLSVVMARRHLEQTDIALCVIDASQGVTSNDATIASYAQQSGRACIIVMNKFDLAVQLAAEKSATEAHRHREQQKEKKAARSQKTTRNVRHERARLAAAKGRSAHAGPHATLLHDYEKIVRAKLKFLDYAPVVFLSAMTGERTDNLFELINRVAAAHRRRVTTGELNRWLEKVDLERGTSPSGRKVKIYYVTQAAAAPPTFVLFTNQARPLHFSYERFLDNQLRAHFDFTGTPIRFNQRLKKR